ncbi:ketosteroid isomerase-like protein [Altererythrobacter atlanticus]|uniref:SnoaL-like domain protein n=1 Tax=Croceibacterium atlanticum TaxID=1267766 RepID=A0A0F7KSM5_9SPHN|nr:nuclear transport factor 2 family protein [Croceibacterium atlanticum]AKH42141.1 SnoaL-like domain protein [Croceibacterium atlanticum]MBB5733288.1 ketosteroid isomerase-like protein [Croceibacterium atlanticum]
MSLRTILLPLALALVPAGVAAQETSLAVETAKVDDLISIREIKLLQARWGHMAMAGDWGGMAGLATEDAKWRVRRGEVQGRGGIEALLRASQGHGEDGMPAGRMNLRLYISPVITLGKDGQTATGRWHEVAMTAQAGTSAGWQGATHVIDYRKDAAGWRISSIRTYDHFKGSYADGWAHDPSTLERAPYHYTPDEAGELLPGRASASPRSRDVLERQATLLLLQGRAQNLVNAYGYYLDRGMYDDMVDLLADDVVIEIAGQGSWRGTQEARAFLSRFGAPGLDTGELNDRPLLMPMVNIAEDGSTALIRNVEIGMTGHHGDEGYWQAAMQTFLLRRDDDGKWRIAMIHRNPIMRSEYEAGWSDPLPAALPVDSAGQATGQTSLASVDFRTAGYAVPPLEGTLVIPPRSDARALEPIPGALAMAEAFDGAENVSNAYGYYIDQFAWRDTAALFSRDGWKELSYIGTFIGKDRVLGSLIQRYGEGGPNDAFQAIHQKTQPFVTVFDEGQRAFVRTRLFQFNSSADGPGSWISGIYENQVIKEDGIWRIHGMDLDYVWLGDYEGGWTEIDPAASSRFGPSEETIADFGPDAPLRGETFAPYPRIAPMGFHFDNPVTGRKPATRLTWSDGHRD